MCVSCVYHVLVCVCFYVLRHSPAYIALAGLYLLWSSASLELLAFLLHSLLSVGVTYVCRVSQCWSYTHVDNHSARVICVQITRVLELHVCRLPWCWSYIYVQITTVLELHVMQVTTSGAEDHMFYFG